MPLRSARDYVDSLRDGRRVYLRGQRVPDVTAHPVFRIAIMHASVDFEMAEDPAMRDLAVVDGYSRYFHVPRSSDDLLKRSRLIEEATRRGATLVVLIKEIGTDALFALSASAARLGGPYPERVQRFVDHCRGEDLAVAVAQTDAKGDRSLGPTQQADADSYLHVVERRSDGIVVRGIKCHTSVSINANELIVLPTRQMSAQDADYAVAFAVPLNAPGLSLIASSYLGGSHDDRAEHPITSCHKMVETTTVFDDVFVPWERVFLCGEWQEAGPLARGFVEFHRFTAISYKLPLVDALVGCATVMAQMNGVDKAGHVRDKLSWLIAYAETLRALTHHAAEHCRRDAAFDVVMPDVMLVNIAKLYFAQNLHTALMYVQDIAGGIIVTSPSLEDLDDPEHGAMLRIAYGGAVGTLPQDRLRMAKLVSELTTGEFGGYQTALAIHAEGSIEAEKLTILKQYDARSTARYARWLAGLEPSYEQ